MMNPIGKQNAIAAGIPKSVLDEAERIQKKYDAKAKTWTATGEAGGGMVKVTINIYNDVTKVEYDCEFKEENKKLIEALVPAAYIVAKNKMDEMAREQAAQMMKEIRDVVQKHKDITINKDLN